MKQHELLLLFKMDMITKFMDKFDMTDGSKKIFCQWTDIKIDVQDDWCLSPAVAEVFEKAFMSENLVKKISENDHPYLCGIYDVTEEIFYNFTDPKEGITMFSNGRTFAHFDTKRDMRLQKYIDAYKRFVFNDKQADDDRFVYCVSGWMCKSMGDINDFCE